METSQTNVSQIIPTKFKVKLIGKSYVGKTTFINKINNPDFSEPYEKSNNPLYKINFRYKYKTDIFYFEEEPEINLDKQNIPVEFIPSKHNHIALLFIFDLTEKESFDYILKLFEKIYSASPYKNILKILIGNKNDLDEKLRQVSKEDIDKATKELNVEYFEISSKKTDDIYKIISHVYLKVKDNVRANEYSYGLTNDGAYFLDKEKLMPNYYEIVIMGDRDSGKNSLKNKFLYDCAEKNVNIYEYCIPRTKNFGNKEIKFDISIKSDNNETKDDKPNEFNPEFFYQTLQCLDPYTIGILLTYDVSNKASYENAKKIVDEIFDYINRYRICITILGMKCDLLLDTELEEKIKEGRDLAQKLRAHFYLVSTRNGYNVDNAFNDILVQSYNQYHRYDKIDVHIDVDTIYNETIIDPGTDIYSEIHVRNEKPKMKDKEKKKIEKQIEKELNNVKKMKAQRDQTINGRIKKDVETYLNNYKEIYKLNYNKIYRCSNCWKIPKMEINEINDTINVKCIHNNERVTQIYTFPNFIDMQSKIPDITSCNFCKNGNYTHTSNFDYCYICQKIFCKKCENKHKNSKECNKTKTSDKIPKDTSPFYLLDSFCSTHAYPTNYYCENCNRYVCDICLKKEHKYHNIKFYDNDYVEKLIANHKHLIEATKKFYRNLEKVFNDMMESIKKKFNDLLDLKLKKLMIKENLVQNLELYKKNYNLVESVSHLQYDLYKFKNTRYSHTYDWKTKLDLIFHYLNEPIYLKNKNICLKQNIGKPFNILQEIKKQSKEEKEKEKEKENKKEKEKEKEKKLEDEKDKNEIKEESDSLQVDEILGNNSSLNTPNLQNENVTNIEGNPDDILITDICVLSKKYFGISSDDGLLKIYNSYNYKDKPYNTIKEYQPNKGIYSLYKPHKGIHLNFNPLYLIGFETIKKLIFDNNYKEYSINEEYKINNCYFINIIELWKLNGILASTLNQEIINVYKDQEKKLKNIDITFMINKIKNNKNIVYISEISADKFNIKMEEKVDEIYEENTNVEKQRLRRSTIGNILRKQESQTPGQTTKRVNIKDVYNVILEIEQNEKTGEITLKSMYEFYKNLDIIGKIGSYYLLVIDKNNDTIPSIMSLFDFKKNIFTKRYYLNQGLPSFYHKLENWYRNNEVFLLLDEKMNLTQYEFDEENSLQITPLYSLDLKEIITKKNKDDNVVLLNVGDRIFIFANNGLIFDINN